MAYGLSDARRALIDGWELPTPLPEPERWNLQLHWQELSDIATTTKTPWKSLSVFATQIVEGLLKQKLLEQGIRPPRMLGKAIQVAYDTGLLPKPDTELIPSSSLSAARILRNRAAHFTLQDKYPSELQATQSLALMISVAQALYPKPRAQLATAKEEEPELWGPNWSSFTPHHLIRALEDYVAAEQSLPEQFDGMLLELTSHIVKHGGSTSVLRWLELAKRWQIEKEPVCEAINKHFPDLIANASRSSIAPTYELVGVLKTFQLEQHANVLAIILPADEDTFCALLGRRAVAWIARYLQRCSSADPQVFAAVIPRATKEEEIRKRAATVELFWEKCRANNNILNAANILLEMPPWFKRDALRSIGHGELLEWIEASRPLDSLNLLGSFRSRVIRNDPNLIALKDDSVAAIGSRILELTARDLAKVPRRLHEQLKVSGEDIGIGLLKQILQTVEPTTDPIAVRRILWDTHIYCVALTAKTVELALKLLEVESFRQDYWSALCLAGMVELTGKGTAQMALEKLVLDKTEILRIPQNVEDKKITRWECFLVVLGYARAIRQRMEQFPTEVSEMLKPLVIATQDAEGQSGALLQEMRAIVGVK
jgi:hypothetical protein